MFKPFGSTVSLERQSRQSFHFLYYGVPVGVGVAVGVGVGVAATQEKSDKTTFPGEVLNAVRSVQLPLVCIFE